MRALILRSEVCSRFEELTWLKAFQHDGSPLMGLCNCSCKLIIDRLCYLSCSVRSETNEPWLIDDLNPDVFFSVGQIFILGALEKNTQIKPTLLETCHL